jgi:intracellular sulfur oxidation DsrE/DsrF family protein
MKRALVLGAAALLASGCISVSPQHPAPVASAEPAKEAKLAFDITNGNPVVVGLTLKTIDLTRKQLIEQGVTPHIVVTFRGEASYFTQDSLAVVKEGDRAEALLVKAQMRELRKASGVESFEQCNIPLASRKLNGKELMPEVKLVPNGWIALANYQQQGYAYIVP